MTALTSLQIECAPPLLIPTPRLPAFALQAVCLRPAGCVQATNGCGPRLTWMRARARRRRCGRECGIGEEGWDAVLRGTAGCYALTTLARLRARPAETRWRIHRPSFHAHPLAFSDCLHWHGCDGGKAGCVGFRESGLGFTCSSGCKWDACLACATVADAAPGE